MNCRHGSLHLEGRIQPEGTSKGRGGASRGQSQVITFGPLRHKKYRQAQFNEKEAYIESEWFQDFPDPEA
jgi:hypothetical protein